jgi:hypothetical protein
MEQLSRFESKVRKVEQLRDIEKNALKEIQRIKYDTFIQKDRIKKAIKLNSIRH